MSMIFNMFIIDLFHFINKPKATNFVDDNTIYASYKDLKNLPESLEKNISNFKCGPEAVILQ